MKITKVAVNYGETVNIGNYESRRVDFSAEARVEAGESPEEVQRQLLVNLRTEAQRAVERILVADRH